MRSIRQRLLRWMLVGTVVLLAVGAACLYFGVRSLLTDQFDASLQSKAGSLATLVEQEGSFLQMEFSTQHLPEFAPGPEPEYFEIWLSDGRILERSPSLVEDLPRTGGPPGAPRVFDLVLPDGRAGRAIGTRLPVRQYEPAYGDPGPEVLLVVLARAREALDDALRLLLVGTVLGVVFLATSAVLGGRLLIEGALAPVDHLADHVDAVLDPQQARPFDSHGLPAELLPLVNGYNRLLERIRSSFERERRTTANIAHELKTPVAELMLQAEVALRYGIGPEDTIRALAGVHEIGEQMRRQITTLLDLARFESGRVPLEPEPVDLSAMVEECWVHVEPTMQTKGQSVRRNGAADAHVHMDRAALSIILGNLFSNAVEYAPRGAQILLGLESTAEGCSLVVENQSEDLLPEDLDKLTEPFWRSSHSRADRSHAGIGLALVRRLVDLLELRLSLSIHEGVFRVRLGFPPALLLPR